jgi:hypothetical protein
MPTKSPKHSIHAKLTVRYVNIDRLVMCFMRMSFLGGHLWFSEEECAVLVSACSIVIS